MTIKRQVFYSFHHKLDSWQASMVRDIEVVEGNKPATDNDWEEVISEGVKAIRRWINGQMRQRSCTIVLVGTKTADRNWINYEIKKAWSDEKGVVGIRIHGLKNQAGKTSPQGDNPFDYVSDTDIGKKLSAIVKCYDPQGANSQEKYDWISKHLSNIVEEAIQIRKDT